MLIRALAIALISISAKASMVVTYAGAPNEESSSLSGTQEFTFDDIALGLHSNVVWTGVGTYNKLYTQVADQYGGAVNAAHTNGSPYSVQGSAHVPITTLTLNTPSAYFGLWWSAGDAANVLDFYSGGSTSGTLVAEFTTANLMQKLPKPSYYGNPRNRSLDNNEPFAFINFFGETNTVWDTIVFRNSSSSGFESDNHTSRVAPWTPDEGPMPGVPLERVDGLTVTVIPEPGTAPLIALVCGVSLFIRRRFIE